MSKAPSYLQMVKEDAAEIRRLATLLYDSAKSGEAVGWSANIRGRVSHLEQCLDCAVAALDDSHQRVVGDFKI